MSKTAPTPRRISRAAALDESALADGAFVAELFDHAAETLLAHPLRQGGVVNLPDRGRLLMTGDIHDHALNFRRVIHLAKLDKSETNYLVLHELIHGPGRINGRDLSVRLLARAAALIAQYPEQVFVLLSNHELAQYLGESILKDSASVVEAFDDGIDFLYGDDAEAVRQAMHRLIRAMLPAVRCANGILCSHSLPAPRKIDLFDPTLLERVPNETDLADDGSAYLMVWGRHHTQKVADELAGAWGVRVFVLGHQLAEMGFETPGSNMLILASDHDHGQALPIDLGKTYTRDELVEQLVPLAGVKASM